MLITKPFMTNVNTAQLSSSHSNAQLKKKKIKKIFHPFLQTYIIFISNKFLETIDSNNNNNFNVTSFNKTSFINNPLLSSPLLSRHRKVSSLLPGDVEGG